ncbi:response regulator [bacterium]|nr:response regulator [bacterium]
MTENQKIKILIVDDISANLVALEAIIEREEFEIHRANGGNEALKLAWKNDYALALVDVQMPDIDGFELVKLLKSNPRTSEIICVFVTAISKEPAYAVKGLQVGAVDYLYKPLDTIVTNAKVDTFILLYQQKKKLLRQNKDLKNHALQINNASDIIAMIDPSTCKIKEVNPAIKVILGYNPEEVIGISFLNLIHEAELEMVKTLYNDFIERGETNLTFEARCRNTRHDYVWLNVKFVYKQGYIFANARDVSENKHFIQEIIKAKQVAEREKLAKEQFLANMSHEIRTPMNGIIGLSNLLRDSDLNTEQAETLKLISQSSNTLLYILNDILDLSKIESGMVRMEMIDFKISDLVKGVYSLLKPKADEQAVKIETRIENSIPEWIVGDQHRLNQILINLVGNAIKFSPSGNVLLEINLESDEGDTVVLNCSIEDTGIGIPADQLDRIFDTFSQASNDTTRKFGGTGLGLPISKKLVELHGGEMKIESVIGKGSTFSFTYPCKKSNEVEKINIKKEMNVFDFQGLKGRTVLLVDDNKINRMVGSRTLKRWQMDIHMAENGEVAVESSRDVKFDVILMDIQMPIMDGYEATRHIRADKSHANNQTPIIALTANVMESVVQDAKESGMNLTMTKPFDPEILFKTLYNFIFNNEKKEKPLVFSRKDIDRIDLNYLKELSGQSQEFVFQYLLAFIEQIPQTLGELNAAVIEEDETKFLNAIHQLKQGFIYIDYEVAKETLNKLEATAGKGFGEKGFLDKIESIQKMVTALIEKFNELLEIETIENRT